MVSTSTSSSSVADMPESRVPANGHQLRSLSIAARVLDAFITSPTLGPSEVARIVGGNRLARTRRMGGDPSICVIGEAHVLWAEKPLDVVHLGATGYPELHGGVHRIMDGRQMGQRRGS